MAERPRFAIIPTNGRSCFKQCLDAIRPQVDDVFTIIGGPNPQDSVMDWLDSPVSIMRDLNISKWWNRGLWLVEKTIKRMAETQDVNQWDVAVLNDDVIVPPNWFAAVADAMRANGAAAGCSGGSSIPHNVLHKEPGPVGLWTRMKGFAFILAGEKGIRADEELRWYFSDDHVDWMARRLGGMLMVPGYGVEHLYPNEQMTPELHETVPEDAAHFYAYWGQRPW